MKSGARVRCEHLLEVYRSDPDWPPFNLLAAICITKLADYPAARRAYEAALRGFLEDERPTWRRSGEPNFLFDAFMMADRPRYYSQVAAEIKAYGRGHRGQGLLAQYACAATALRSARNAGLSPHVAALLMKPKVKDTYAMGLTIDAIAKSDQESFDVALDSLLKAHRGRAKFGALRETAEGFLCLSAMSLSKIALQRGMQLRSESEYLSTEYLEYLLQEATSLPYDSPG